MLIPSEAQNIIFKAIQSQPSDSVDFNLSLGRVLHQDIVSDRDYPPYNRATMDGYGLRAESFNNGCRKFYSRGVQKAGDKPSVLALADDACIEIMTGAVVPEGVTAVVPYEEVDVNDAVSLKPGMSLKVGQNIHAQGSDAKQGTILINKGKRVTSADIAVMASCGYQTVAVNKQPRIALISSGDELVDVSVNPQPHQIRKSNVYAIKAALSSTNFLDVSLYHFRDNESEVAKELSVILDSHDCIILTGGVSQGKTDYFPPQLLKSGVTNLIHGVAQKPGKPFWFGISKKQTPVFALPGNPVSSYVCLHRYVLPALFKSSGCVESKPVFVRLNKPVSTNPKITAFVAVKISRDATGQLVADPLPSNTSGDFIGLIGTDGFIELQAGQNSYLEGTSVSYIPWA